MIKYFCSFKEKEAIMKEEFLHYVWQYKLFSSNNLLGTKKESITVTKSGTLNTNSGPDFLNAHLLIDGQKWVGNVEIHLKSSDWYQHHHEDDINYDAVILHVVFEDDVEVFMKNNKALPTLVLKNKIDATLLHNYKELFLNHKRWIACERDIVNVDAFLLNNWLERLYLERLEQKSIFIKELLLQSNNNYEAVLFQLLAKNFGLKVNADAFLSLAQSLDFSILRKESFHEHKLSALLFGQAGFLEGNIEDEYYHELKKEYGYLKHKHKLKPINKNQFQFFRMRPNNFPTIRIAQLIAIYFNTQNVFSKLIHITKIEDAYTLLTNEVSSFWQIHYTFEKSSKRSPKKLTKSFIDLLLIKTIIPLKFVFEKNKGEIDEERILKLIQQIKPEKNTIISKFSDLKVTATNAFESQALLQLKNMYCKNQKCLHCSIGNYLIAGR